MNTSVPVAPSLRQALEQAGLATWDWNLSSGEMWWNPHLYRLLGLEPGSGPRRLEDFSEHVHPEDRGRLTREIDASVSTGNPLASTYRILRRGTEVRWLHGTGGVVMLHGLRWMTGVTLDVGEMWAGGDEAQADREQVESIRRATRIEERQQMAQELHDSLTQGLFCIRLRIGAAEELLAAQPKQALEHLASAREIAQTSLNEGRRAIERLRSPLLEGEALETALQRLAAQAGTGGSSSGVAVVFKVKGATRELPAGASGELYRITQEALTNALRHSGGNSVLVQLDYRDDGLVLSVFDDGHGFVRTGSAGLGLSGIEDRARRIGAGLDIRSDANGTEVRVELAV